MSTRYTRKSLETLVAYTKYIMAALRAAKSLRAEQPSVLFTGC